MYFKPAAVAQVDAVIGGLLIDWVTLHEGSPGVGRSIADLRVRRQTRHDDRRHRSRRGDARRPRSDRRCSEVGDQLVVIGRPEDLPTFMRVVVTLMGTLADRPRRRLPRRRRSSPARGRRIGLPTIPLFMARRHHLRAEHARDLAGRPPEELELLAALGLVLLLFHLGLEFSLDDVAAGGRNLLSSRQRPTSRSTSAAGSLFGFALGWGTREALVIAGAIGISSSAIVTKLLVELRRLANPETRLILGIVVVEDLFLALYLAALQPVLVRQLRAGGRSATSPSPSSSFSPSSPCHVGAPASSATARSRPDDELLTIAFLGVAILTAGVAEELGVSDAIGAFLAGTIIAVDRRAPAASNGSCCRCATRSRPSSSSPSA